MLRDFYLLWNNFKLKQNIYQNQQEAHGQLRSLELKWDMFSINQQIFIKLKSTRASIKRTYGVNYVL